MKRIAFFALLAALPLSADEVHLKGGTRVKGIAEESGGRVVIRTLDGQASYDADQVERIDRSVASPLEEYLALERKAATPADFVRLADWVRRQGGVTRIAPNVRRAAELATKENLPGLVEAARASALGGALKPAWERVLALDPGHAGAREALGQRVHDGKWMTPDEVLAATGHVLFEGRWVTPAERDAVLAERRLGVEDAQKALNSDLLKLEDLRRSLEELKRELEAKRLDLAEREAKLAVWEKAQAAESAWRPCHDCGGRFQGGHFCAKQLTHCGTCGGYFPGGHRCRR